MKKILLVLVVVLSAMTASAQATASGTSKQLQAGHTSGTFLVTLPAEITTERVNKSKSYYTNNFSVNFNETTHEATIVLSFNDEMNRRVVMRFLSSLGINKMNIDGKELTMDNFYELYLK